MVEQKGIVVPQNVPEELRETVHERIKKSNKKYQARKAKQDKQVELRKAARKERHAKKQEFRKLIEEGTTFFNEHKEDIINGKMSLTEDFKIAYAIMKAEDQTGAPNGFYLCLGAYSIKAPTDEWSDDIANGICGYRLKHITEWTISMPIPIMIFESAVNLVHDGLKAILKSRIIFLAPEIPQRVSNVMFRGLRIKHRNRAKTNAAIKAANEAIDNRNWAEAKKQTILAVKFAGADADTLKEGLMALEMKRIRTEGTLKDISGLIGSILKQSSDDED